MEANQSYDNEQWWQENNTGWREELEKRRWTQAFYTVQEIVLTEYFRELPQQSKVLEFGCGFGRHLAYLSRLSNLTLYGVDQSPTMLAAMKQWMPETDPGLLERVKKIEPRSKLPFPDKYFDVSFTVSGLIHVQPEHLHEILKELTRVTKHQILHFENLKTETDHLAASDHAGYWMHRLAEAYVQLGLHTEVFTGFARKQDLYAVNLSQHVAYRPKFHPVWIEKVGLLDATVGETLEKDVLHKIALEERADSLEKELFQLKNALSQHVERERETEQSLKVARNKSIELFLENGELRNRMLSLDLKIEILERKLNIIESSLSWRMLYRMKSNRLIRALLLPPYYLLRFLRKRLRDTKNPVDGMWKNADQTSENIRMAKKVLADAKNKSAGYISMHHPEWLGVTHATKALFTHTFALTELTFFEAKEIGKMIGNSGIQTVIFSGFAAGWFELAKKIYKANPKISIKIFWHGNTTHVYEDYSYHRFNEILALYKNGCIRCLGFAKKSMADLYAKQGYQTAFIMNKVTLLEDKKMQGYDKPKKQRDKLRIGIYASGTTWNKNAYTQLAAASLLNHPTVSLIPCNDRLLQYALHLGLTVESQDGVVERETLLSDMAQNDVNLYVTFSECAPLLPLESLYMGVICISGPNHSYFKGTELEDLLVCKAPDDPVEIAAVAKRALANQEKIMDLYQAWSRENHRLSDESVREFLKI